MTDPILADPIFTSFLQNQKEEGLALSRDSDILDLYPNPPIEALLRGSLPDFPPLAGISLNPSELPGDGLAWIYLAVFHCRGLVRVGETIREANRFEVAIQFRPGYLRFQPKAPEVLHWVGPPEVFHPNIRPPFLCPGRLQPGTTLCDLLYQIYEIVSYQKVNPREDDALNPAACRWARSHQDRLPVDPRPLKRRDFSGRVEVDTRAPADGPTDAPTASEDPSEDPKERKRR